MAIENQPETGNPPVPATGNPEPMPTGRQEDFPKLAKKWEERFDKLKEEIGEKLGEASNSFETLKNQVVELAKNQKDLSEKLNLAINEIRVIGGRALERANPDVPARVEKKSNPLTLLELAEDE